MYVNEYFVLVVWLVVGICIDLVLVIMIGKVYNGFVVVRLFGYYVE